MKTLLKILLFCFFFSHTVNAQFSIIQPSLAGSPDPSILYSNNGYIVANEYILNRKELQIARLDLNGNTILQKSYSDSSVAVISSCNKCLKKKGDFIYYGHTGFLRQDSIYVVFSKFSQNLDTVYTKKLISFEGALPKILNLKFDSDTTFIASGFLYRNTGTRSKYDLWVARFDTSFQELWQQRIPDQRPGLNFGYYGEGISFDSYSYVLISGKGIGSDNATSTYDHYSFAARFNLKDGQLKWIKEFTGPAGSENLLTLNTSDATYPFAQMQYLGFYPNTTTPTSTRLRTGLIDTSGIITWDTLIGPQSNAYFFNDFQTSKDGNYYISGSFRVLPSFDLSYGFKFSPSGDSLWFRTYHHLDSSDLSRVWAFQPTNDSGFIHIGYYLDWDNDLHPVRLQYSWLLKTDQYGCQIPNCQSIGINEYYDNSRIEAYPNPVSGKNITLSGLAPFNTYRIEIYNEQGALIRSQKLNPIASQAQVNIGTTNPGLYILQIHFKEVQSTRLKIIVQ